MGSFSFMNVQCVQYRGIPARSNDQSWASSVVLLDREAAGMRPDAARGVGAPGGGQGLDHVSAVAARDDQGVAPPAALHRFRPGFRHLLFAEAALDEVDQPQHRLRHEVVEEAPLRLHGTTELDGAVVVACLDGLDHPVESRSCHLSELFGLEPALFAHGSSFDALIPRGRQNALERSCPLGYSPFHS
jgi:hypothetical protein